MTAYTCLTSILSLSASSAPSLLAKAGFNPFEFGMLLCFGICWPVSIFKSLKSKRTEGKSLLFIVIVWIGYISGLIHKIFFNYNLVIILYIANFIFVLIDILLYLRYSRHSMATLKVPFKLR